MKDRYKHSDMGRYDRNDRNKSSPDNEDRRSDLIVGRNAVTEALRSGASVDKLFVNPDAGGSVRNIIRLAKEKGVPIKDTPESKLSQMCGGMSHQGVIAAAACAKYVTVDEILDIARQRNEQPFIIICDGIEDPHNLGAVIRTAEAAGAHGIIIPKRRSASLDMTVYKTSAGAASWLAVARVPNLAAAVDDLKKSGVWIFGTDGSGEDYKSVDMSGAIGLVIGSEGFGMSKLIKDKCDYLVSLPMRGRITSLNASVAAGIFMYEAARQRGN